MSTKSERVRVEIEKCHQRLHEASCPDEFNSNMRELAILLRLKWQQEGNSESKIFAEDL